MTLPAAAEEVLRGGVLCYLAAPTSRGPHCTPVVFVLEAGSIWATTRRGALKARLWRRRPEAAALVRHGPQAVTVRGHVTLHDLLDASTWSSSFTRAGTLARASARFTAKNARFFAGYARDAHRVPLAWTPPARIVAGLHLDHGALLGEDVGDRWGFWRNEASSLEAYKRTRRKVLALPEGIEPPEEGSGVLALEGFGGTTALPVSYRKKGGAFLCFLPRSHLALAGAQAETRAALVIDRASSWRAAAMRGVMLQGTAQSFLPDAVGDGADALARDAGGSAGAVVRVLPDRATWWRGWSSGTVSR